ncbi:hypothetical protein KBC85_00085 [Candidatus Saccharibacteria bacterium]|nr:hypothetical protein [Candidatus Saccharibacteria bacterium]MDQ5885091.1 hypothetical protein [Patescibacteria group bacterium]MDQ5958874.1 hypothetical protein [Patescibacteria group bacterium]
MNQVSLAVIGLTMGLAVGFNPTLISIVSIYMASMIGRQTKKQYYTLAGLFLLIVFALLVLLIAGLLTTILSNLSLIYSDSINLLIAILGVITGTSLVRRYFWPKPLMNVPDSLKKALNYRTTKKTGIFNILYLALFLFFASLNTVGITLLLLSSYNVTLSSSVVVWSLPFAIGLIIPLYFIIVVITLGNKVSVVIAWKENNKNTMRLCSGLIIILLSWLQLLIIATGEIIVS